MRSGVLVLGALGVLATAASARSAQESVVADAAMRRDSSAVRVLLRQGADANAAQRDGMTALHWAAMNGDSAVAQMLLYAGARTDLITRNGSYTPLHLAAKGGYGGIVRALVRAGADASRPTTSGGATPLHFAVGSGDVDAVTALLDAGAKVDAPEGAFEQTPLMWAAAYNRVAALEALIARGANVRAASKIENVPARDAIDRATNAARNRRIAALRAAEQPPATAGRGAGAPPAAGRGGADGGGAGGAGAAGAAGGGRGGRGGGGGGGGGGAGAGGEGRGGAASAAADSVNSLGRSIGYSELVGDKGGLAPLHFAAREGNTQAALALLKAGADINQLTGDKTSPLLMATINGHFDLARVFVERGANPKLASVAGNTPLYATLNTQWAAKSLYPQPTAQYQQETTYLELMEALLKAGADVNARLDTHLWYMSYNFDLLGVNTSGATPFWRAAYGTDVPAMRLLVKHGADHRIATYKPAGRVRGDDAPVEDDNVGSGDPSGLPPIPNGGPGVHPIHAASGVGYGEGYAANAHNHAPDSWLASVKYLVEELGHDVNARDHNGYAPLHHAAARGDNELILWLVSKGADVKAVSRRGQTVADMANGPVQRIPPFVDTVKLLESLGSKNSNRCRSC